MKYVSRDHGDYKDRQCAALTFLVLLAVFVVLLGFGSRGQVNDKSTALIKENKHLSKSFSNDAKGQDKSIKE